MGKGWLIAATLLVPAIVTGDRRATEAYVSRGPAVPDATTSEAVVAQPARAPAGYVACEDADAEVRLLGRLTVRGVVRDHAFVIPLRREALVDEHGFARVDLMFGQMPGGYVCMAGRTGGASFHFRTSLAEPAAGQADEELQLRISVGWLVTHAGRPSRKGEAERVLPVVVGTPAGFRLSDEILVDVDFERVPH